MIKLILAVALCFCYVECSASNFEDYGYCVQKIEHDGHTWMCVRMNETGEFKLIHHPDCEKCYIDIDNTFDCVDTLDRELSCVETQTRNGQTTYTVDQYGSVDHI